MPNSLDPSGITWDDQPPQQADAPDPSSIQWDDAPQKLDLQSVNDQMRQMFHAGKPTAEIVAFGQQHGVNPNPDQIDHARANGMDVSFVQPQPNSAHNSIGDSIGAGINHIANSLAFDYGPEVGGAIDKILHPSSSYSDNVAKERAILDQQSEAHPVASFVGELGGVGVNAALGNAAGLANLGRAGNISRVVGEGALYGSGAAGPDHRVGGAVAGAIIAPVAVGALKVAGAGVNAVSSAVRGGASVLQGSPGLARRIIAKAIKEDMNTPESAGQMISEAQGNGVPMTLGDTGENVRGLLAASSRASGMGRTIVRDALEERQSALADRIVGHIERDLGPVANPHQVADDLMTKARDEAGPLYDAAYAKPGADAFVQKVAPLLDRPSMQKALGKAYRIASEEGRNPEELGLIRDANGNVKLSDTITLGSDESGALTMGREPITAPAPTWQTLDYVKRGMDDVVEGYRDPVTGKLRLDTEGHAINNTLRTYMKAFDAANPEYAAARKAYSDPVSGINAMNLGRKALTKTGDDIEAQMRDMTPFQKQMYALGLRRAMAETVSSRGDTADIVHALAGTGKKRAMLARAFGDRQQFQRFVNTLSQEREGWRSYRQALLGSPTAANVQDDAMLQTAATATDFVLNGGMPIATATSKAVKFLGIKLSKKAQEQIAALLSNTDPASIRELAAELRAQAEQRGLRVPGTVKPRIGNAAVVSSQSQ
jgi:hypothetical protein